jgi:hypothetical protein
MGIPPQDDRGSVPEHRTESQSPLVGRYPVFRDEVELGTLTRRTVTERPLGEGILPLLGKLLQDI